MYKDMSWGVLQGMTRLLKRHAVRDIIFEEEAAFPAPTHKYLKSNGYSIFGLQELFARVRLSSLMLNPFSTQLSDQCQITSLRWTQTRANALLGPSDVEVIRNCQALCQPGVTFKPMILLLDHSCWYAEVG